MTSWMGHVDLGGDDAEIVAVPGRAEVVEDAAHRVVVGETRAVNRCTPSYPAATEMAAIRKVPIPRPW